MLTKFVLTQNWSKRALWVIDMPTIQIASITRNLGPSQPVPTKCGTANWIAPYNRISCPRRTRFSHIDLSGPAQYLPRWLLFLPFFLFFFRFWNLFRFRNLFRFQNMFRFQILFRFRNLFRFQILFSFKNCLNFKICLDFKICSDFKFCSDFNFFCSDFEICSDFNFSNFEICSNFKSL
jgi:hypothetical protein